MRLSTSPNSRSSSACSRIPRANMRDLNDLMTGPKKSGVPSVPPAPENAAEPEESPTLKRMKGGMVAGAFAGFVAAKFYMDWQANETPAGTFYGGNPLFH